MEKVNQDCRKRDPTARRLGHLRIIKKFRHILPIGYHCTNENRRDPTGKFRRRWDRLFKRVIEEKAWCEEKSKTDLETFKLKNWCKWRGQAMDKYTKVLENPYLKKRFNASEKYIIEEIWEMELPLQLKKGQPLPGAETDEATELDDGGRSEELGDAIDLEGNDEAAERIIKPTSSKQRAEKRKSAKNKGLKLLDGMAERRATNIEKRKLEPLEEAPGPSSSKQPKKATCAKKRKLKESTTERAKKSKLAEKKRRFRKAKAALKKEKAAEKRRLKKARAAEKRRLKKSRAAEKRRLQEAKEAEKLRQQALVVEEQTSPENGDIIKDGDGDTASSPEFDVQGFVKEQQELKETIQRVKLILKT